MRNTTTQDRNIIKKISINTRKDHRLENERIISHPNGRSRENTPVPAVRRSLITNSVNEVAPKRSHSCCTKICCLTLFCSIFLGLLLGTISYYSFTYLNQENCQNDLDATDCEPPLDELLFLKAAENLLRKGPSQEDLDNGYEFLAKNEAVEIYLNKEISDFEMPIQTWSVMEGVSLEQHLSVMLDYERRRSYEQSTLNFTDLSPVGSETQSISNFNPYIGNISNPTITYRTFKRPFFGQLDAIYKSADKAYIYKNIRIWVNCWRNLEGYSNRLKPLQEGYTRAYKRLICFAIGDNLVDDENGQKVKKGSIYYTYNSEVYTMSLTKMPSFVIKKIAGKVTTIYEKMVKRMEETEVDFGIVNSIKWHGGEGQGESFPENVVKELENQSKPGSTSFQIMTPQEEIYQNCLKSNEKNGEDSDIDSLSTSKNSNLLKMINNLTDITEKFLDDSESQFDLDDFLENSDDLPVFDRPNDVYEPFEGSGVD